jgi:hypothetical protein
MKIYLPALDIEFQPRKNHHYEDHGIVDNIAHFVEILSFQYGAPELTMNVNSSRTIGKCLTFWRGKKTFVHIGYKQIENPKKYLALRAHEESHALRRLRGCKPLELAYWKELGIPISTVDLEGETFAAMGEILALKRDGEIPPWFGARPEEFRALQLYDRFARRATQ